MKTCRFLLVWIDQISTWTHTSLLWWCGGLNVSLKYLTPSSTVRDSRSRSPLYVSASPTSLFFSAGPCVSSTVRSNQSSINFSFLNQDVDPPKSGQIFVAIPLPYCSLICRLCAICSNQVFGQSFFVSLLKNHLNFPHSHSLLTFLKVLYNIRSRGILCTRRSSSLQFNDALRNHFVNVICSFCVNRTCRNKVDTSYKNPQNCNDSFSSLGSSLTKGSVKWWYIDSLNKLPFSSQRTPMTSHECKLTGWPWVNKHQHKMIYKWLETAYDSASQQNKTTQDKWQRWWKDCSPSHTSHRPHVLALHTRVKIEAELLQIRRSSTSPLASREVKIPISCGGQTSSRSHVFRKPAWTAKPL